MKLRAKSGKAFTKRDREGKAPWKEPDKEHDQKGKYSELNIVLEEASGVKEPQKVVIKKIKP